MDQVSRIEQELDSFKGTLSAYREQLERWYSAERRTRPVMRRTCRR